MTHLITGHDPPYITDMHIESITTKQQEASIQHNHASHMEFDSLSDHAGHMTINPSNQTKQPTWVRLALGPYWEGKEQETEVKVTVGRKRAKVEGRVENKDETCGKERKKAKLDVRCPYPTSSTVEAARQPRRSQ